MKRRNFVKFTVAGATGLVLPALHLKANENDAPGDNERIYHRLHDAIFGAMATARNLGQSQVLLEGYTAETGLGGYRWGEACIPQSRKRLFVDAEDFLWIEGNNERPLLVVTPHLHFLRFSPGPDEDEMKVISDNRNWPSEDLAVIDRYKATANEQNGPESPATAKA